MKIELIQPSIKYKTIDGFMLQQEREKLSLSQTEFAKLCGHSQQYQSQLELPGLHEITGEKAKDILCVLEKYK